MRCITGDECGLLKEYATRGQAERDKNYKIKIEHSNNIHKISSSMSRQHGVASLTWMQEDAHFASLLFDGSVQIWEGNFNKNAHGTYQQITEIPNVVAAQQPLGIYRVSNRLVACDQTGCVSVVDAFRDEDNVVDTFRILKTLENGSLSAHAVHDTTIALGGKERETVLFDISTHQQIFKAKNLPPDPQTLLAPQVWPSSATFLDHNTLVVGTAYHQVRVYDLRTNAQNVQQRRPVCYTDHKSDSFQHRITAVTALSDRVVAVADGGGNVLSLDLLQLTGGAVARTPTGRAIRGRFSGPAGSIKCLYKHPTLNVLAAVGLDRNLFLFNTQSLKVERVVYLKQRLNAVLMTDEEVVYDRTEQDTVQELLVDSDGEPNNDMANAVKEERERSVSSNDDDEESSDDESDDDEEETTPKRQRKQ